MAQLAAFSVDEKPPPKSLWLDDEALKTWRENQTELKSRANQN